MRATHNRQTYYKMFNNLFKPSCINCKYFLKDKESNIDKTFIIRSTCQKFLINPQNNINQNTDQLKFNYQPKHPYALLARFDITMCGLNGIYFTPINK